MPRLRPKKAVTPARDVLATVYESSDEDDPVKGAMIPERPENSTELVSQRRTIPAAPGRPPPAVPLSRTVPYPRGAPSIDPRLTPAAVPREFPPFTLTPPAPEVIIPAVPPPQSARSARPTSPLFGRCESSHTFPNPVPPHSSHLPLPGVSSRSAKTMVPRPAAERANRLSLIADLRATEHLIPPPQPVVRSYFDWDSSSDEDEGRRSKKARKRDIKRQEAAERKANTGDTMITDAQQNTPRGQQTGFSQFLDRIVSPSSTDSSSSPATIRSPPSASQTPTPELYRGPDMTTPGSGSRRRDMHTLSDDRQTKSSPDIPNEPTPARNVKVRAMRSLKNVKAAFVHLSSTPSSTWNSEEDTPSPQVAESSVPPTPPPLLSVSIASDLDKSHAEPSILPLVPPIPAVYRQENRTRRYPTSTSSHRSISDPGDLAEASGSSERLRDVSETLKIVRQTDVPAKEQSLGLGISERTTLPASGLSPKPGTTTTMNTYDDDKGAGGSGTLAREFENLQLHIDTVAKHWEEALTTDEQSTLSAAQELRLEHGLPILRGVQVGAIKHRKHSFEWRSKKLMCWNVHNPVGAGTVSALPVLEPNATTNMKTFDMIHFQNRNTAQGQPPKKCANEVCAQYCCHYGKLMVDSIPKNDDVLEVKSATRAQEMMTKLRSEKPMGIEEWESFQKCSFCRKEYCPDCITLCAHPICGQPFCVTCCNDTRPLCDDYHE